MGNFKVGDKAVYPGHGVGEITAVERLEIANTIILMFTFRLLATNVVIRVPVAKAGSLLRPIISRTEAQKVLCVLSSQPRKKNKGAWGKHAPTEYRTKNKQLCSLSPVDVARMLKSIASKGKNATDNGQGSRVIQLRDQASRMLSHELALAMEIQEADAMADILRRLAM